MNVAGFAQHFGLGLLMPLTAVCVVPLYPAFIAFLASTDAGGRRRSPTVLGALVLAGVVTFMALIGVIYSLVLGQAVNDAVQTISPIAFWILLAVGVVMLVDPGVFARLPTIEPPQSRHPTASAFSYGFFFGAIVLGALVLAGVVAFMALIGIVYSLVLGQAVNDAVQTISPIAFWILLAVGVVMLVDPGVFARLPTIEPPQTRHPTASAFSYGFFFGAIVLPCNPGLIAAFFTTTPVLYATQLENMLGFLAFGLGIGTPLLALAVVSDSAGELATRWLARHSTAIYRTTGLILLAISGYYLAFVLPIIPAL